MLRGPNLGKKATIELLDFEQDEFAVSQSVKEAINNNLEEEDNTYV